MTSNIHFWQMPDGGVEYAFADARFVMGPPPLPVERLAQARFCRPMAAILECSRKVEEIRADRALPESERQSDEWRDRRSCARNWLERLSRETHPRCRNQLRK